MCRSVAYTCHLAPSFCMQLLLVVGWQCLLSVSSYCSIQDTSGCLRNWPMIPVEANVLKYYNVELGWYLHLMLKHPLGENGGWVWGFELIGVVAAWGCLQYWSNESKLLSKAEQPTRASAVPMGERHRSLPPLGTAGYLVDCSAHGETAVTFLL